MLGIAVLASYGFQQTKPQYSELTAPIPVTGVSRSPVVGRTFSAKVERVTLASGISRMRLGKETRLTTSGIWVVVEATLAARASTTVVAEAMLKGPTGLAFRQSQRVGHGPLTAPHRLDPGLPRRALFVFEVPRDQIHGTTLMISESRFSPLDSQLRIELDPMLDHASGEAGATTDVYRLN